MSKNEAYEIKELTSEDMLNELNNTSPLNISKKLIEYELYDQQNSIDILNQVYEEFENGDDVINSLVNPMLFNVADGLIKHPKLNGTFRKTNITPSRLVNEINNFSYDEETLKEFNPDLYLRQAEKSHYGKYQRKNHYDKKKRETTEKEKGITRNETIFYENKNGEVKSKKTAIIQDEITGEDLDLTQLGAKKKGINSADMDHINPINNIRKKFKNNPYLCRDDLERIIGLPENESYINAPLNSSKGDKTWSEYIATAQKDKNGNIVYSTGKILLTPKQQQEALELEQKAQQAINKEAAKQMAKNISLIALGDSIILIIKPIYFEIQDIIKNGVLYGFKTDDKLEAFILRFKRAFEYIKKNVIPLVENNLKDIFENFLAILVSSLVDIVKGIFKKFIQIISDGFMAIKEAFKIMMKADNEITSAQKADAITKIIASAIVPILTFSLEETFSKIPLIGDVGAIIISGLATTLVVWALDQIDLFSTKDEKRMMRVKEIFELRIKTIKKNTDIFESNSLEILAKQKLQFKKITETMSEAISNNLDVNSSVLEMATFMNIDLKVKSTNDFINLLNTNHKLVI